MSNSTSLASTTWPITTLALATVPLTGAIKAWADDTLAPTAARRFLSASRSTRAASMSFCGTAPSSCS